MPVGGSIGGAASVIDRLLSYKPLQELVYMTLASGGSTGIIGYPISLSPPEMRLPASEILQAIVVMRAASSIVRASYISMASRIVGAEVYAPVMDTLATLYPEGLAESLIYRRNIATPENIALKYFLAKAKHKASHKLSDRLRERLLNLLNRTWLSWIPTTKPGVDSRSILASALERIRSGATTPEYRALIPLIEQEMGGGGGLSFSDTSVITTLSKIVELYVLSLLLNAANIRNIWSLSEFVAGTIRIRYQAPIDEAHCIIPDIIIEHSDEIVVVEVKLASSTRYIMKGISQLNYYIDILRNITQKPIAGVLAVLYIGGETINLAHIKKCATAGSMDITLLSGDHREDLAKITSILHMNKSEAQQLPTPTQGTQKHTHPKTSF